MKKYDKLSLYIKDEKLFKELNIKAAEEGLFLYQLIEKFLRQGLSSKK